MSCCIPPIVGVSCWCNNSIYRDYIYGEYGLAIMNPSLGLKLLLIRHGKCSACKDKPRIRHCGVCFNTRLEPEVLEAITALDLADKFKENEKRLFENVSEDDYVNPPEGSYFNNV